MIGDLDSRDEGDGDTEKYDLAEPDEVLKRYWVPRPPRLRRCKILY